MKARARSRNSSRKFDYGRLALPLGLVVIIAILVSYIVLNDLPLPSLVPVPDLSTEGYTEIMVGVNVTDVAGIVSMSGNCRELSVTIDRAQALSIANGINGVITERPNTHDLMKDLLNSLDAKILMVKITDMRNSTYYSEMIVRERNLIVSFDSRPSDALAVSARTSYPIPIYIRNDILDAGVKIC
jgi:hypothetical protein